MAAEADEWFEDILQTEHRKSTAWRQEIPEFIRHLGQSPASGSVISLCLPERRNVYPELIGISSLASKNNANECAAIHLTGRSHRGMPGTPGPGLAAGKVDNPKTGVDARESVQVSNCPPNSRTKLLSGMFNDSALA